MARKSASWLLRRAATNAPTACSAVVKLRWSSGAFGGAACATPTQSVAARIGRSQLFGIRIKVLLTPSTTATSAATASTTATTSAAAREAAATPAAAGEAAAAPTASERWLLRERSALRTTLSVLTGLAASVHVTERATRTLRAGKALASSSRPLCRTIDTADTTRAADATHTAWPASSADTTHAAGSANSTDATHTAGAGRRPHRIAGYRDLRSARLPHRSVGRARKIAGPPSACPSAPTVRSDLRAIGVDVVVAIDVDIGITAAPSAPPGTGPTP